MKTLHVDRYFTSLARQLELFDREARKLGLRATTAGEVPEWQRST